MTMMWSKTAMLMPYMEKSAYVESLAQCSFFVIVLSKKNMGTWKNIKKDYIINDENCLVKLRCL